MTPINARNKFYFKRRKLLSNIFLIFILISGYSIYSYYNRLVRVNSFSNADDVFELYRDWSKSSNYYMKYSERMNAENYYLIKKMVKYILSISIIINLMSVIGRSIFME